MSGRVDVRWDYVTRIARYRGMSGRRLQVILVRPNAGMIRGSIALQIRRWTTRWIRSVASVAGRAGIDHAVDVQTLVHEVSAGIDDLPMTPGAIRILRMGCRWRKAMTTATSGGRIAGCCPSGLITHMAVGATALVLRSIVRGRAVAIGR